MLRHIGFVFQINLTAVDPAFSGEAQSDRRALDQRWLRQIGFVFSNHLLRVIFFPVNMLRLPGKANLAPRPRTGRKVSFPHQLLRRTYTTAALYQKSSYMSSDILLFFRYFPRSLRYIS
jgi:hypothetical protein